ncbi:MAG: hypothetical protein IID39_08700 [Planctomycetes bacterium]|nr:hypothetical protein [Planctomycetota bacterium]
MHRKAMVALTLAMAAALSGCASPLMSSNLSKSALRPRVSLNPHLLFDRIPGPTHAAGLGPRESWPTAIAGQLLAEQIVFQEHIRDYQGGGRQSGNEYRRRFVTYRTGRIERR